MEWIQKRWAKLERGQQKYLFILLLLALTLRLSYVLAVYQGIELNIPPIGYILPQGYTIRVDLIPEDKKDVDMDSVEYDHLGWSIARGQGMVDRYGDPTSFRFPGYPYFLGLIYFIFGHRHLAVLIIQAILGAIPPLLLYLTARKYFSEKVSRLAGIIAASYPIFIYYIGWIMSESLFFFFLSLLIYLTVTLGPKASWKKLIFTGVIIGLLSLTRGMGLPFVFLIPAYVFFLFRGKLLQKFTRAAAIFAAAVLMLVPWSIRNSLTYHRVMLPSSEGGVVLWMSFNNVSFTKYYITDPAFDYLNKVGRKEARSEAFYAVLLQNNYFGLTGIQYLFSFTYPGEPLPQSEVEASQRLGQKARELLHENPRMWLNRSFSKVFRFWHVLDERGRYLYGYGFIIPFFLVGVWKLRRRTIEFLPLYGFFIVLYGITVVFDAGGRYRMPFEGVIIIIGAYVLGQFLSLFRRKHWGYGILVGFFLCNYYLALNSTLVRLGIRSVASALGFRLIEM